MKMNKLVSSILVAGVVSTSLYAQEEKADYLQKESQWYVGIGTMSTSGTRTLDYDDGSSASASTSQKSTVIKIGKVLKNSDRFEFLFTKTTNDISVGSSTVSNDETALEYHGVLGLESLRMGRVLPYTGLLVGYWANDTYYENTTGDVMNGVSLGASLGAIYQINQTVELDAGYHYKKIFWITDENDNKDMSEDMSGVMLSVNIKF